MKSSALWVGVLALFAVGCAHGADRARDVESPPPPPPDRDVLAVESAPPEPVFETAKARPKLTRTLTLGRDNGESTYQGAPTRTLTGDGTGGGPVTNVYINNQSSASAYSGGGYGYRGYGGGRGYAAPRTTGAGYRGASQWGASGWEGAGRTAGPGRTPSVGGNWAPAQSFGPSQMR